METREQLRERYQFLAEQWYVLNLEVRHVKNAIAELKDGNPRWLKGAMQFLSTILRDGGQASKGYEVPNAFIDAAIEKLEARIEEMEAQIKTIDAEIQAIIAKVNQAA